MSPNKKPATSLTGLEYGNINATEAEPEDILFRDFVFIKSPYETGRKFTAVIRRYE